MKRYSLLLSLFISLLSVWPCCTEACGNEESISINAEDIFGGQQQHDDCNSCSPFLACGSCLGFTLSGSSMLLQPVPLISATTYVGYMQENRTISISSFIWQPPKFG